MSRNVFFLAFAAWLLMAMPDIAFAQITPSSNPFGGPRPPALEPASGMGTWLLQQQAAFHRQMITAFRGADGSWAGQANLLWLAFLYGVFHAIGPGHGKAVIASYIVANEQQAKRGIALAFAAALVQALIALALVLILILLLGQTARTVDGTVIWLERIGFAIIFVLGLLILVQKLRALLGKGAPAACNHEHGMDVETLSTASWRAFATIAVGAGLRPCTGAVILLVFALSLRQFLTGALAVGVMALGTAIGTSLFALLAVKAKHFSLRLASGRNVSSLMLMLEAFAGGLLALLGLLMMTATISPGG